MGMGIADMREAKAGRAVMRISPAQLSESKCPSLADSFRLNGFAQRGSGDERVGGHKSVQLAPRGRRRDGHSATYRSAFVRPPFPNLFRRAARLLPPRRRFPLYSGREREGGELCQITTANFGKSGRPDHLTRPPSRSAA